MASAGRRASRGRRGSQHGAFGGGRASGDVRLGAPRAFAGRAPVGGRPIWTAGRAVVSLIYEWDSWKSSVRRGWPGPEAATCGSRAWIPPLRSARPGTLGVTTNGIRTPRDPCARGPALRTMRVHNEPMRIAAVILAAGASTRFGSPKQLARIGDRTM